MFQPECGWYFTLLVVPSACDVKFDDVNDVRARHSDVPEVNCQRSSCCTEEGNDRSQAHGGRKLLLVKISLSSFRV